MEAKAVSFTARAGVSRSRHSAEEPDGSLIASTSACRSRRSRPPVPCGSCNAYGEPRPPTRRDASPIALSLHAAAPRD